MISVTYRGTDYDFDRQELDLPPDFTTNEVLTALGRHFNSNFFEKMQVLRTEDGNWAVTPATTYG